MTINRFNHRGLFAASMLLGLAAAASATAATPFGAYAYVGMTGVDLPAGGAGHIDASQHFESYYPGSSYGTSVYAAADLGVGALHASAITTDNCNPSTEYCNFTGGSARAAFWDTVTFTSKDGAPLDTIELLPTALEIDGHLSGSAHAYYRSYFGADANYSSLDMPWEELDDGARESLDTLLVPLGAGTYYVYFELWTVTSTNSKDAIADFGNTLQFSWVLPDDVEAHSASGTFLNGPASAVPEPATWAMMVVGFGLVGSLARRNRIGRLEVA